MCHAGSEQLNKISVLAENKIKDQIYHQKINSVTKQIFRKFTVK